VRHHPSRIRAQCHLLLGLVRVDGDRLTLGDIACHLLFILFQYTGRGFAVWRLLDDVTLVETAEATVVVWA